MTRERNLTKREAQSLCEDLKQEENIFDPKIVHGSGIYVSAVFDTGELQGTIEIHDITQAEKAIGQL